MDCSINVVIWLEIIYSLLHLSDCIPAFWCPTGRYPAPDGKCKLCYEYCGPEGCSGSGRHLGEGGCTSCWLGVAGFLTDIQCMSPFDPCPPGHYRKTSDVDGRKLAVCRPCHSLCQTCSGSGVSYCDTCRFRRENGVCVRACPSASVSRGRRRVCLFLHVGHSRRRPFYLLPYRDRYRNEA